MSNAAIIILSVLTVISIGFSIATLIAAHQSNQAYKKMADKMDKLKSLMDEIEGVTNSLTKRRN
jgi:biopolymer transport protein ExbB/TolQ